MSYVHRFIYLFNIVFIFCSCQGVNPAASHKGVQDCVKVVNKSGKTIAQDGCGGIGAKVTRDAGGEIAHKPRLTTYDGLNGKARNPIVSHIYTADPSAKVFNGRIYIYASHDLDNQDEYMMHDYHIFSSDDLVNWQDHGVALDAKNIPWATRLFAPDAVYSEVLKKYFLYFPDGGDSIGVAVSDTPYGPFVDALGKPLITRQTPGVEDVEWVFDPSCFIDDDGQVYLYFGGGMPDTGKNARVIRLNEDMVSVKDKAATVIDAPDYFEAPFVHKYQGKYYFTYSTTFKTHPPAIDYMVSDHPMTGFKYKGTVLPNPTHNRDNNNHHSIVEYKGEWYIFYHNRVLANQEGMTEYQRSITLDKMTYTETGDIARVSPDNGDVAQLQPLDGRTQLQAETMADGKGIEVAFKATGATAGDVIITDIHNGDWIGYSQIDFGDGVSRFVADIQVVGGGVLDIYLDGCDLFTNLQGTKIGSCTTNAIEASGQWQRISCDIDNTSGVHDIYLRFSGKGSGMLFNFDFFEFR